MKVFTKEIRIAIVAIVGIVLLFFGMNYLKGVRLLGDGNNYYINFTNIDGLSESNPVKANGFKVGTVTAIKYDYDNHGKIVVEVDIDKRFKIPAGTVAEISSDLLGNVQVDLLLGEGEDGFMQPLDTINGSLNAGAMGKVKEMIPVVEKMLPKVDSILMSVNSLMADPALPNTLHHAEQVTHDLTNTTNQIICLLCVFFCYDT